MSKKSRKKSSKTPSGIATAKKTTPTKRATTQTKSAKTQRTPASKSTRTVAKAGSHKAASKQLKSSTSVSPPAKAKPALTEGQKAPAFRLPRDGGDVVSLADYAGRKLVLFFDPLSLLELARRRLQPGERRGLVLAFTSQARVDGVVAGYVAAGEREAVRVRGRCWFVIVIPAASGESKRD